MTSMDLSLFKCKNCGAELDTRKAVGGVIECVYCHTPWTVPKEETTLEALKYLHDGNAALDVCKFEDAYTYFQKAAELDASEPEAYFGMALASFKVQFLRDEVNNCLQPICHEISEKVFSQDKNYVKALSLASLEQKRVYRRKGGEIDEIRDEFYAHEKSGLKYDCFICVKVTEEDGRTRTEDYNRANDIYYHLKDNGYKPFYSEREMKGRTGSAYEALILYALYTSECMLIVCSDEGYLQTKWVKNEYTRFMSLMQEGGKERDALTFVFTGKPIEKLPNGKKIQGIDLAKPDAYSKITEYVHTHTPEARRKREEEWKKGEEASAEQKRIIEEQRFLMEEQRKELERMQAHSPDSFSPEELRAMMQKIREQEEQEKIENLKSKEFQRIGNILMRYNGSDKTVEIPDFISEIGENAFSGCKTVISVFIPENVKRIQEKAFCNCASLSKIQIPEGVTEIGWYAFQGCSSLESINIPSGITDIGFNAFEGCSKLSNIRIPDSVTNIGWSAFEGCSSLVNINIPSRVQEIGGNAFNGCLRLSNITIPNEIKKIGYNAFRGCNITNLTIPKSVTYIGNSAFECPNLKSVTIPQQFVGFLNSGLKKIFGHGWKKIHFTFT